MRPYKGKKMTDGEWVIGCYLFSDDETEHRIVTSCIPGDDENMLTVCAYPVDPKTVGQYTGKDDVNGEPVFCHDIIEDDGGNTAAVIWDSESCQFLADFGPEVDYQDLSFSFTLVGNLFDAD